MELMKLSQRPRRRIDAIQSFLAQFATLRESKRLQFGKMRSSAKHLVLMSALLLSLQISTAHANDGERPAIPDLSYPDLSGQQHNLRQWKGHVLMLNFWASWCAPCQAEIKHLIGYQRRFGAQGLQIVGLGLDDPRKLKNVQRTLGINYPILSAEAKESRNILNAWGNKAGLIPYTVIFDSQGQVVQAHRGIIDDQLFESLVKPLLSAPVE
jgi:peroxiredoxin